MRRMQAAILFLFSCLAAAPAVRGAGVAELRPRWQDLLVQEPQVLAPQTWRAAESAWNALEEAERRSAADVAARAAVADSQITRLEAALGRVRATWPAVLQARAAAREARVPDVLPREWRSAENIFMAAARKLESGRATTGARQAEEARAAYDAARVAALRRDVLGEAHAALARLDALDARRYVPRSYVRALDAVNIADAALQQRGGADVEVRAAAARAGTETQHALFLLERVRAACEQSDAAQLENTILDWEESVQGILRTLGLEVSLEESVGAGLGAAAGRVAELAGDSRRLQEDAARQLAGRDSLAAVVRVLQDSLRASAAQAGADRDALAGYRRFLSLETAFTRDEGRVFLDNRDVVLRLPGVQFESGTATLNASSVPLLDRVAEALRAFPGASVVVEAHTDGQGAADAARELSQRRADAVRLYLIDKVPVPAPRVTAVGWGASRPLVAESSEADRALNRRIEIIVSPGD